MSGYCTALSLMASLDRSIFSTPQSHCIINDQKVISSCAVTDLFFFFSLSNVGGFNKKNLSFLLFLLTVLPSVLSNNSSPVVSADEEGHRKRARGAGKRAGLMNWFDFVTKWKYCSFNVVGANGRRMERWMEGRNKAMREWRDWNREEATDTHNTLQPESLINNSEKEKRKWRANENRKGNFLCNNIK